MMSLSDMTKKYFSLPIIVVVFATLLGSSPLGMALERDSGGAYHLSWSPISSGQSLPTTGVISVTATDDGSFVVTVLNKSTGQNEYYSFDPANADAGWQRIAEPEQSEVVPNVEKTSALPFAYGCRNFNVDKIALPDDGLFSDDYEKCHGILGDYFEEMVIYGGNALGYCKKIGSFSYNYYWHSWPCSQLELQTESTCTDRSDFRNSYLESPNVFYTFKKNSRATFYIAVARERKTNTFFSLVISYGFPSAELPVLGVLLVADPIASAGEVIVGVAGSKQGYVAVGADGTSYFAAP